MKGEKVVYFLTKTILDLTRTNPAESEILHLQRPANRIENSIIF